MERIDCPFDILKRERERSTHYISSILISTRSLQIFPPRPIDSTTMSNTKEMPEAHVEDARPHVLPPDVNNEMSVSIWDTIKANPKTIGWCCTLASGPMVYGFDLIIVSQVVAMPAFQYVSPIFRAPVI